MYALTIRMNGFHDHVVSTTTIKATRSANTLTHTHIDVYAYNPRAAVWSCAAGCCIWRAAVDMWCVSVRVCVRVSQLVLADARSSCALCWLWCWFLVGHFGVSLTESHGYLSLSLSIYDGDVLTMPYAWAHAHKNTQACARTHTHTHGRSI